MSGVLQHTAVRRSAALGVGLVLALALLAPPVGAQTTPAAPTVTANASATTSGAIEVTWTEVTGALGYLVTPQRLRSDGQWVAVEGRTQRLTGRRPVIFDGLVNGSSYRGCVAAFLADAFVVGLSTGAVPYGLPGVPAVNSVDRQGGTVTVSWSPAADNGRQISSYEVSVAPNDVSPVVVGGNETSAQLSGLRDGVDYTVSVRASNLRGQGEAGQGEAVAPAVSPTAAVPEVGAPRVITVAADAGPCAGAVTTAAPAPAPAPTPSDPSPVESTDGSTTATPVAPSRSAPPASGGEASDDPSEPAPSPAPSPAAPAEPSAPGAEPEVAAPAPSEVVATEAAGGTSATTLWVALLALAGLVIGGVVVQQRVGRRSHAGDAG